MSCKAACDKDIWDGNDGGRATDQRFYENPVLVLRSAPTDSSYYCVYLSVVLISRKIKMPHVYMFLGHYDTTFHGLKQAGVQVETRGVHAWVGCQSHAQNTHGFDSSGHERSTSGSEMLLENKNTGAFQESLKQPGVRK